VFLHKLDLLLVFVLKHEWPHNWPSFIPEITGSSMTSPSLCANNVHILRLLSEEVVDFSKESLTAARAHAMRATLEAQLESVVALALNVLKQPGCPPPLIVATLQMMQRYVTWIPDVYLFQTELLPVLCNFLTTGFRVEAVQVLAEVGALARPAHDAVFEQLFLAVMKELVKVVPPHVEVAAVYSSGAQQASFLRHLALFLTSFFKSHLPLLEQPKSRALLNSALEYLLKLSNLDDPEILKICLEFWQRFSHELFVQHATVSGGAAAAHLPALDGDASGGLGKGMAGLALGGGGGGAAGGGAWAAPGGLTAAYVEERKLLHREVLSRAREVMIARMAKPEEVLIEEDDSGEIVREQTKDTDALAQYKVMKDSLVYLTHLDPEDTTRIMRERLKAETDKVPALASGGGGGGGGGGWGAAAPAARGHTWEGLNTLCWAIGSISGTMADDMEKLFLVHVIRDLLQMCETVKGKQHKAVVASNIMYVVGQYPRFLKCHWKFLKTVVMKLFEFMHESHPGVKDMAVDTFLKIASKCRKKFVARQADEAAPFVDEVCANLPGIIAELEVHQVHTFYEAAGTMVAAHTDAAARDASTAALMHLQNQMWAQLLRGLNEEPARLRDPDTLRSLQRVLRSNVCACRAIGGAFHKQLGGLYLDALQVYKALSANLQADCAGGGEAMLQGTSAKAARAVKREVLALVSTFVAAAEDARFVAAHFVPPLLGPVLEDYAAAPVPQAREAEALNLLAELVAKLRGDITDAVPAILSAVFEPTLAMLSANQTDFPEHRAAFFKLLAAITAHAFPALLRIPAAAREVVVRAVVWAFKHTARDIGELGLSTLEQLLERVALAGPDVAAEFFSAHLLNLLRELLEVVTDRLHKAHLKQHARLLQLICGAVETGRVGVSLWECPAAVACGAAAAAAAAPGAVPTNQFFVRFFLRGIVGGAFSNVSAPQLGAFVEGLFDVTKDQKAYKTHMVRAPPPLATRPPHPFLLAHARAPR
jgi:exportin-1